MAWQEYELIGFELHSDYCCLSESSADRSSFGSLGEIVRQDARSANNRDAAHVSMLPWNCRQNYVRRGFASPKHRLVSGHGRFFGGDVSAGVRIDVKPGIVAAGDVDAQ